MSTENRLKITSPVIIKGTRTVTFEWSDKSLRSDVTYSITWGASNNTIVATKSGATVTGLEPGASYSFVVTTSLPRDGDYPPVTVDQTQGVVWTRKFYNTTIEMYANRFVLWLSKCRPNNYKWFLH